MVTSGIEKILVSVRDMGEALAFFRDWVGMEVAGDQSLDGESIEKLWNLPAGTKARTVFLKNAAQTTLLELIEFRPHSGKTIRAGAKVWDYGIYDIAFFVKNIDKTYKELIDKGFTFVSPPIPYAPDWVPFSVKEAVLIGPNEMPIAHIEIVSSRSPDFQIPEIAGAYGALVDSAQMVDSIDDAIHFYRDILGLTMQGDYRLPRGLVDEVLTLPPGTDSRIAFFNKEGSTGPLVEFLEYSLKGNYLSSVARPPNLGIFMISFETADLSGLISAFNSAGVKILSGPITMDAGPHGAIRTMVAEGPGRAMVEFYEKQG